MATVLHRCTLASVAKEETIEQPLAISGFSNHGFQISTVFHLYPVLPNAKLGFMYLRLFNFCGSVRILTKLQTGRAEKLDLISGGGRDYSLCLRVQICSGARPAFYSMSTRGSFYRGKAAGAWSWPLVSICCQGWKFVKLYRQLLNTSSRRGA
jgi:hypothetical protein